MAGWKTSAPTVEAYGFEFELENGEFGIWAENWPIWQAFLAIRTQWRTGPVGASSLDYTACLETWKALGFKKRGRLLKHIQSMETEIITAWAKERETK